MFSIQEKNLPSYRPGRYRNGDYPGSGKKEREDDPHEPVGEEEEISAEGYWDLPEVGTAQFITFFAAVAAALAVAFLLTRNEGSRTVTI